MRTGNAAVNSSCAQPPPPLGLLRGICPPCHSRGWGIWKFYAARRPGICQPRASDTHAVSYQNTELYRRFVKDGKKLKRFVKACSRFYACISSLLIKPELHSETRELSTWINVLLVIESSFSWYYLKNILDGGRGICPLFSSPLRGICHPSPPKNANARGQPERGGWGGVGLVWGAGRSWNWLMHNSETCWVHYNSPYITFFFPPSFARTSK